MKDANQPLMVTIAGVANIGAGLFNLLIGFFYLFVCYGIIVMPVGLWQVVVGILSLKGKRVPSHLVASLCGAFVAVITFDVMAVGMSLMAAILLGVELTMAKDEG